MKNHVLAIAICVFAFAAAAFATVTVTSPANNSTQSSAVKFVATSTTSCSKGVASMGIYPSPYQLVYTVNGASLNTTINLNPGTYNVVVEEWDHCGGATTSTVKVTVKTGNRCIRHLARQ